MAYKGYIFTVGDLELPYAPSKLKITIGSNNQTVNLISGNEINILKHPKLTEIEFDAELPRGRQYPFAKTLVSSKTYTDYFEKLMLDKTPIRLVIDRPNPLNPNQHFESNDLKVSLEGYTMAEDAENAYDVVVSLKFKQYIDYGTVKKVENNQVKVPEKPVTKMLKHTVKSGDCLWKISRKYYGTSLKWRTIYNANKTVIENTAKKYGKKSSYKGTTPGWWIYPGTVLRIPITVKK